MPGEKPKRSYWDSSVFLALINNEDERVAVVLCRKLHPADAIHLSTATRNRCEEILTYDTKWPAHADMVSVKISEPSCTVRQLPFE